MLCLNSYFGVMDLHIWFLNLYFIQMDLYLVLELILLGKRALGPNGTQAQSGPGPNGTQAQTGPGPNGTRVQTGPGPNGTRAQTRPKDDWDPGCGPGSIGTPAYFRPKPFRDDFLRKDWSKKQYRHEYVH